MLYGIPNVQNLKKKWYNELICETETDSQA